MLRAPATRDTPRYVTQADIKFFLKCTPGTTEDDVQRMLDSGIWRLTDDPRLGGQLVDPIAMPARGRC